MSKLLEEIVSNSNMNRAYKAVVGNKGTSGVDGVTVEELYDYIKENWGTIKEQTLTRSYYPKPVRRVEIPKPNGKKRKLGIPTVMDRVIQQAMVQVLTPICEPEFSEYSYGFRPNRSCEKAIIKVLEYMNDGFDWIVDIDLEKFFDNVPQDKLMSYVHNMINDGDVESLIYKYLRAGVMVNGKYENTEIGTPQGGNLSPLLSNVILNELDKELERRGLCFARYADDCIILVRSEAAAKRVMYSITKWIEKKLGLKVNMEKTQITRPGKVKYLGFGFWYDREQKRYLPRPHQDSVKKFKSKLKSLTVRRQSINFRERIRNINRVTRGWVNYYAIGSMESALKRISEHLRTRLRMVIWKMWKVPSGRQRGLEALRVDPDSARLTAYCGDRYFWVATKTCVKNAISKKVLSLAGLIDPYDYYSYRHSLYSDVLS